MTLGEKIKARREELEISQGRLADAIGVNSAKVISNWEKDINKPDIEKLSKLCQALSCTGEYFLPTDNYSFSEQEVGIIQKFRILDKIGQDVVINALEHQAKRCGWGVNYPSPKGNGLVTAHWIEHNKKNYECSNYHNEDGLHSTYPTKYCHDCGAIMSEPIEQQAK